LQVVHRYELIDWPRRLAQERPFLTRVLGETPSRRVLDLGCGIGRHARLLASLDLEVVGIDGSEEVLEVAQDEGIPEGVQFLLAEMGAVEMAVRGHFGAAICLGNTIPYLLSTESLARMLVGLRRRLLPGAPLLLQLLNYDRIFERGATTLPVESVPSLQGDLEVVREVKPREDGIVVHTTSARLGGESVANYTNLLRGWRLEELMALLDVARVPVRDSYGDMQMSVFDGDESPELVLVAG
jgi:SAM-dependent methyltransferase